MATTIKRLHNNGMYLLSCDLAKLNGMALLQEITIQEPIKERVFFRMNAIPKILKGKVI